MKKILFITDKFPYPLDTGGKIRTFHVLKGLSLEYDITLLTTVTKGDDKHIHEMESICNKVYFVTASEKGHLTSVIDVLKNIFSQIPFVVERHYSKRMEKLIKQLACKHDIIHFDHLDASIYMQCLPAGKPVVLDEHNIVSNQLKTYAIDAKGSLKGIYAQLQYNKTMKYESCICNSVTRCFVCSDADKRHLKNIAAFANISTVPNGVDIDYFSDNHDQSIVSNADLLEDASVVFVGALDYGPGSSAVAYFCKDILPLLRSCCPKLSFIAVGQNPPESLVSLAQEDPKFVLTGRVDDVRGYMQKANVFVVPLRSGSGTRLKILSAMSMRIPVVSTTIGAEGLAVTHGENILIADTPQAFCAEVIRVLQDRALSEKISNGGRKLVEERYSWNVVWKHLLSTYKEI